MDLEELLERIKPIDPAAADRARERWKIVAKPLGALGLFEEQVVRIAAITGQELPVLHRKAVVSFCADNGVVAEGVTQCGQEVTATVARNMALGRSSVCRMAAVAGADVFPVDVGMVESVSVDGLAQCAVRRGTANFTKETAMSREECEKALFIGAEKALSLIKKGYNLLAAGEMGIGNTTTSSAVVSVLLDVPPASVTGRGAGLSGAGLARKISVIEHGIALHCPQRTDAIDVLCKVGGLDLAAMTGFYLGCAAGSCPVLLDGFISYAAALAAANLCPAVKDYLLPSHCSEEPASRMALTALGLEAPIHAGMRLGEGTGAVAAMPLIDMALAVYSGVPIFAELEMEAYQELK